MEKNEKNYVGKGWERTLKLKDGNTITSLALSLKIDDLNKLPVNEYGDIKLIVGKRRSADEKSKATHWVAQDNYKKAEETKAEKPEETTKEDSTKDDLQF